MVHAKDKHSMSWAGSLSTRAYAGLSVLDDISIPPGGLRRVAEMGRAAYGVSQKWAGRLTLRGHSGRAVTRPIEW
jgi:hypothetical protein